MEYRRLGLVIREADSNFRKAISAVASQLGEIIKDNNKSIKGDRFVRAEECLKRATDTPRSLASMCRATVGFIPRKTNVSKREANEEVKERGLKKLNSIKNRETYSISNPLIIDGKNVFGRGYLEIGGEGENA